MPYPQGINFRNTSGFVTDGANEDYELASSGAYPRTSAQGNTIGHEGGIGDSRDRNSGIDRRLAGTSNFVDADRFRFDLPAIGDYNVRVAEGDDSYAHNAYVELFDTTTSLGVLCSTATSAAGKWRDATDAEYSAAAWPGSNTAVQKTFTTTICRFKTANAANIWVSHLYVEAVAGGGGERPLVPSRMDGVGSGNRFLGNLVH